MQVTILHASKIIQRHKIGWLVLNFSGRIFCYGQGLAETWDKWSNVSICKIENQLQMLYFYLVMLKIIKVNIFVKAYLHMEYLLYIYNKVIYISRFCFVLWWRSKGLVPFWDSVDMVICWYSFDTGMCWYNVCWYEFWWALFL